MGRTLKRVPLDFGWPLKKTWGGYLNPFWSQRAECPDCGGSGRSPEEKLFSDQWYGNAAFDPAAYGAPPLTVDHPAVVAFARRNIEGAPDYYGSGDAAIQREARRLWNHWKGQWSHHLIQADVDALVAAGRLYDFCRRPRNEEQAKALAEAGGYWMKEPNGYTPTADEVNTWSLSGMGHDAINQWVCVKARCEREGVETGCKVCGGDGDRWPTPEIKARYEAWKPEDPPTGEGFQLWETTSEGSPVSPVFETIEELCTWCADNATTFGSSKASAEDWRRMLDADFVTHTEGNMVFM
jgi:hypothetical protein